MKAGVRVNQGSAVKLDVIGGGYDNLAHLTVSGLKCLGEAEVVFHPRRFLPGAVRLHSPAARLVPYGPADDPVELAGHLGSGVRAVAILLDDGLAGDGCRKSAALASAGGACLGYHPSVPRWQSAMSRAGVSRPSGGITTLSREEVLADNWTRRLAGKRVRHLAAVGFDGRVLWPGRVLSPGGVRRLASFLPEEGEMYLLIGKDADGECRLPLSGRGIVVTRAMAQASDLSWPLLAKGAAVFSFPTIDFVPVDEGAGLPDLKAYDGLILTSANAVDSFMERLLSSGHDARRLGGMKIMAVGSKTGRRLRRYGLVPDLVPADFRAEGLIRLLDGKGLGGKRYLLPRAEEAREILPEKIRAMGGEVDVLPLYRTVKSGADAAELEHLHRAGLIDAVAFTSGSTLKFFMEIMGAAAASAILRPAAVACLGPVTVGALEEEGLAASISPSRATVEDLVAAMEDFFGREGRVAAGAARGKPRRAAGRAKGKPTKIQGRKKS